MVGLKLGHFQQKKKDRHFSVFSQGEWPDTQKNKNVRSKSVLRLISCLSIS